VQLARVASLLHHLYQEFTMLNLDRFIVEFDKGLRTLLSQAHSVRPYPDDQVAEAPLSETEKNRAAALMRVNHSGEICAQALLYSRNCNRRQRKRPNIWPGRLIVCMSWADT
jgi:hypothetical protein